MRKVLVPEGTQLKEEPQFLDSLARKLAKIAGSGLLILMVGAIVVAGILELAQPVVNFYMSTH